MVDQSGVFVNSSPLTNSIQCSNVQKLIPYVKPSLNIYESLSFTMQSSLINHRHTYILSQEAEQCNLSKHVQTLQEYFPRNSHPMLCACVLNQTDKSVNKVEPSLAPRRIKAYKHKDSNQNSHIRHAKAPIEGHGINVSFIVY